MGRDLDERRDVKPTLARSPTWQEMLCSALVLLLVGFLMALAQTCR